MKPRVFFFFLDFKKLPFQASGLIPRPIDVFFPTVCSRVFRIDSVCLRTLSPSSDYDLFALMEKRGVCLCWPDLPGRLLIPIGLSYRLAPRNDGLLSPCASKYYSVFHGC